MTTATEEKPVRLQRSRKKGSKLVSPNGLPVVCVSRGTKWGNPIKVASKNEIDAAGYFGFALPRNALQVAVLYKLWLRENPEGRVIATMAHSELRGKNLACWCPLDQKCHADVLLEIANV